MRTYRRQQSRDPDRRMAIAVRLRAEGLSLRQIAGKVGASHETVRRDIAGPRPLAADLIDPLPGREYQRAMRATPGPCQMCGQDGARQIDHCHRHVAVRGLVCPSCNCSMQMVDSEIGTVLLLIDDYALYGRRCPGCSSHIDRVLYLLRDEPVPLRSIYRFKPPGAAAVRTAYDKVRPLLAGDKTVADVLGEIDGQDEGTTGGAQ